MSADVLEASWAKNSNKKTMGPLLPHLTVVFFPWKSNKLIIFPVCPSFEWCIKMEFSIYLIFHSTNSKWFGVFILYYVTLWNKTRYFQRFNQYDVQLEVCQPFFYLFTQCIIIYYFCCDLCSFVFSFIWCDSELRDIFLSVSSKLEILVSHIWFWPKM